MTAGALSTKIKGADRKRWVREAIEEGRVGEIEEWMLQENLPDPVRIAIGKVHPRYMGGEYLPDFEQNEVEIARVTLESTTQDVSSIRAKTVTGRIEYRIVDEYETNWEISPTSSLQPLSMSELISMMDNAKTAGYDGVQWKTGVTWGPLTMNLESSDDPASLTGFVEVTSEFYPGLKEYYVTEIARFLRGLA
jgi:hypothetical protein